MQVADKFHIMHNLLTALKGIAKEELPLKIYIKDGEIFENKGTQYSKVNVRKLNYDNSPVTDTETGEIIEVSGRKKLSKNYFKFKKK